MIQLPDFIREGQAHTLIVLVWVIFISAVAFAIGYLVRRDG